MDLTAAERFFIDRRRRDETQDDAAHRCEVAIIEYLSWEKEGGPNAPRVRKLEPHERCVIFRRRAGLTQAYVADGLNRSRRWVNLMETGQQDPSELLEWWGE